MGARAGPPEEEMSYLQLTRALHAAEIRGAQAERALLEERQRSAGRSSTSSRGPSLGGEEGGHGPSNHAKPRLAHPTTFDGKYEEVYNVLNWLHQTYRYLSQCRCKPEDFSGYARTYLSETVQAWMDAHFAHDDFPSWDQFSEAMISRWLPPDHDLRLELLFGRMRQRDTLQQYVESWQVLDSALTFSQVHMTDTRKVMQFVTGLRERDEKRYLLDRDPETLADLYQGVVRLRQAKLLTERLQPDRQNRSSPRKFRVQRSHRQLRYASDRSTSPKKDSGKRELHRLEGEARQKAWAEGRCLGCRDPDHLIAKCPKLKRAVKRFTRQFIKKAPSDQATQGTRKPAPKGRRRLHRLDGSAAGQADPASGNDNESPPPDGDDDSDISSTLSESENSSPESEG